LSASSAPVNAKTKISANATAPPAMTANSATLRAPGLAPLIMGRETKAGP
jgi:hypothetical protein